MSREVIDTLNMRVTIDLPTVTREQLRDALTCMLGRTVNDQTCREAETIVADLMRPVITVEPVASLLIHLPLYQHIAASRSVRALKIAHVIPNPRGVELHFENTRYAPIQVPNQWAIDWAPEATGYYGHAVNGEDFYLDGDAFERNYTMIEVGA